MLCHYGCGLEAKHQNKSGNWMCDTYSSKCPENKRKNSESAIKSYIENRRLSAKERYNTYSDESKERMVWNRGTVNEPDFSLNGKGNHKAYLIKENGHKCEKCNNTEWMGNPIALELEHKDGNHFNNERSNLEVICPNCHSQTRFYRGRNKASNRKKLRYGTLVEDDVLTKALRDNPNIRQALISVGLAAKGGNYNRASKLLNSMAHQESNQFGTIWINRNRE